MNPAEHAQPFQPLSLRGRLLWASASIASFHLAYELPFCGPLIVVFLFGLLQLSRAAGARSALHSGWIVGLCVYGPQLFFFWSIFHQAAIALWLILGSWLALFLLLQRAAWLRLGQVWGTLAAPALWMGLEYFRSELYYLRFSWLNAGYVAPQLCRWTGMYGAGFALMLVCAVATLGWRKSAWRPVAILSVAIALLAFVSPLGTIKPVTGQPSLAVAGVQLEETSDQTILKALDKLYAKYPDTPLYVLSEYSFGSPVPPEVRAWCAQHKRWLIAGGKQFLDKSYSQYHNTAFVIGPDGAEIFRQAKSWPIQFFDDGLPAVGQAVWESPWGKIGVCICYDLSYTRVTDVLIRQGAQTIIVPTMDVQEWGAHEHNLHARVAPARAAEYGVPIFRLCSSGISQAVERNGRIMASASFPGQGQTLATRLYLPPAGRLPADRLLVWPCMAFAAGLIGWQILDGIRRIAVRAFSPKVTAASDRPLT